MERNKIIIMGLMAVIVVLMIAIAAVMIDLNKSDSDLAIASKKVDVGGNLVVKLTDAAGNPIPDGVIHIKLTDKKGNTTSHDVTTNSKGKAKLEMDKKGKYSVECSFDGNDKFKSSSDKANVTVKKSGPTEHHMSVEVPEFDTKAIETSGEYKLEVEKWRGGTIGGFGVSLYKNGQLMDRNSYQSRAYFCMDGVWKWSNWDNGEEDAVYQKYPVSNDVQIKEVEVSFYD